MTQINVSSTGFPANGRCYLFSPDGGGIPFRRFSNDYLDASTASNNSNWSGTAGLVSFNPDNRIIGMGSDNQGANSVDLLGQFAAINLEICKAINRRYNINSPVFSPPSNAIWFTQLIGGNLPNLTDSYSVSVVGLAQNEVACYYELQQGGSNRFVFSILEN